MSTFAPPFGLRLTKEQRAKLAGLADKITTLSISQTIAADTNFSVTSSGTGYTFSGDAGDLLETAALFNDSPYVHILVNGILQKNNVGVVWVNKTTFKLNHIVDNGDTIVVFST